MLQSAVSTLCVIALCRTYTRTHTHTHTHARTHARTTHSFSLTYMCMHAGHQWLAPLVAAPGGKPGF